MNNQNLHPVRSESEAREKGKHGGLKSGQSRRKRKRVKAILETVLNMPIDNDFIFKDIQKNGLPMPENPTYFDFVVSSVVIHTAKHGQMGDLLKLMDILGETPTENEDTLEKVRELLDTVDSVID